MQKLWCVCPADLDRSQALAQAIGIHPLTAQLLLNRGVTTPAQAHVFLDPSAQSLSDPFQLPAMADAIRRIRKAVTHSEPILIFGDSDVDGLTSSLILYEALRELGAVVRAQHSNRLNDGYGFPDSLARKLQRSSTALVLLVDCGTNQPETIQELQTRGIDTIVVDHHVPLHPTNPAYACVNPYQDPGPGRELCSAGLAFKLVQALWSDSDKRDDQRLESWLDLAALGTLADYAPFLGDNRAIIRRGVSRIVNSHRPGLRQLCAKTQTHTDNPDAIVRRLVPWLNASGRLGAPQASWNLLEVRESADVEDCMSQVEAAHQTTKSLLRQSICEAEAQVGRMHFRDHYVLLVARTGWHQGVMGPIASQLLRRYERPAIAIAFHPTGEGVGSGRSAASLFNMLEALKTCQNFLERFGGHAYACGLSIHSKNLDRFREALNRHGKERLGPSGLLTTNRIDLELGMDALDSAWVSELKRLEPFGVGNPRPTVVIRDLVGEMCSVRKGWLTDGKRRLMARGSCLGQMTSGIAYDGMGSPVFEDGEVVFTMIDVRRSVGPSPHDPSSGTPYRHALA